MATIRFGSVGQFFELIDHVAEISRPVTGLLCFFEPTIDTLSDTLQLDDSLLGLLLGELTVAVPTVLEGFAGFVVFHQYLPLVTVTISNGLLGLLGLFGDPDGYSAVGRFGNPMGLTGLVGNRDPVPPTAVDRLETAILPVSVGYDLDRFNVLNRFSVLGGCDVWAFHLFCSVWAVCLRCVDN